LSPALGDWQPSEMMSAMWEMCPHGEEKKELFACPFLQRLPREIQVLLSWVDHKDPKVLAEKGDARWTLHGQLAAVATIPPCADAPPVYDEQLVAACEEAGELVPV
jgi:hypothetical protein